MDHVLSTVRTRIPSIIHLWVGSVYFGRTYCRKEHIRRLAQHLRRVREGLWQYCCKAKSSRAW